VLCTRVESRHWTYILLSISKMLIEESYKDVATKDGGNMRMYKEIKLIAFIC
jgi:hypothetical protein